MTSPNLQEGNFLLSVILVITHTHKKQYKIKKRKRKEEESKRKDEASKRKDEKRKRKAENGETMKDILIICGVIALIATISFLTYMRVKESFEE